MEAELKSLRRNLRISFTACVKKVEDALKIGSAAQCAGVLKAQLRDKFARLEDVQERILKSLLDGKPEDYDKDFSEAEVYRDTYVRLSAVLESFEVAVPPAPGEGEKRKFDLPRIEFKKFGGDPKDYLAFWAQFEKVHKDPSIPDEDKFQYLIQCVIPGSKAARLVCSYPPTRSNYQKAIMQLKARFGRDDLLVQIYVRELLSLVAKSAMGKGKVDLGELYDLLESKLQALESLGRTKEKFADFLEPLVESCLPENVLRAWERKRSSGDAGGTASSSARSLEELMNFLRAEVESEEMISLARAGLGPRSPISETKTARDIEVSTASALITMQSTEKRTYKCIFCAGSHLSADCFSAREMSLEEKRKVILNNRVCLRCLRPGHFRIKCQSRVFCTNCQKPHLSLMCPGREEAENLNLVQSQGFRESDGEATPSAVLSSMALRETVYLQTVIVRVVHGDREVKARLLFDSGAQRSYVSQRLVDLLGLQPVSKQTIVHGLFGGEMTKPQDHKVYNVVLRNLDDTYSSLFQLLAVSKICSLVPKVGDLRIMAELKTRNIRVSDLESSLTDIDILLGADMVGKVFLGGSMVLDVGLLVCETRFGNTLLGKVKDSESYRSLDGPQCSNSLDAVSLVASLHCSNLSISDLWELDSIGIRDPGVDGKQKVFYDESIENFRDSLSILPDGRLEVKLPFKNEIRPLCNKASTLKRHRAMCQKAAGENLFTDYVSVFQEWENLGIVERVPQAEIDSGGYFLPHRPVVKQSSESFKIRPVFDASSRDRNGLSLNGCLEKGPNLIELIPDIIDRFRLYPIGLSADVEKAFLQLSIMPSQRDFLRFFYPSLHEEIIYRHCRVVFGVTTSPFLLAASINHLLGNVSDGFSHVAQRLRHSFYVDNCVTGVQSICEVVNFVNSATEIMSRGRLNLRGWESNAHHACITKSSGQTSLLGLIWDLDRDTLKCAMEFPKNDVFTKRSVLSIVQRVFDPLGILCPATIVPKILLQEVWNLKLKWDEHLPPSIEKKITKWLQEMKLLGNIEVPRYLLMGSESELHLFVDASKACYGACIYLRTVTDLGVKVQFVKAKGRVAPLKALTIPRLELMACCLGARLVHSVLRSMDVADLRVVAWSDSMVALWWLRNPGDWSVFVSNRAKEINSLMDVGSWRHVPGSLNVADLLSRGCTRRLADSSWLTGPSWLAETPDKWPENLMECNLEEVNIERRKVSLGLFVGEEVVPWYAVRFSDFRSIIRLVAWVLRFIKNVRNGVELRQFGSLSLSEEETAEKTLIRLVQSQYFPEVSKIPLVSAFTDEEGFMRVKTRLTERIDEPSFICPIILPDGCILTRRLIEYFHRENCHAGTQMLLGIIREQYWILRGRKMVRRVVRSCKRCQRFRATACSSEPVSLPPERVNDAAIFEVIGVDLAGPLFVKGGSKVWIALYTCAVYRAVHLELVCSLSAESFLLSLRRFIARRGRPRVIYSDNGTNFRGAARELSSIDWKQVESELQAKRISWKFNPPTAAWWGGFWERLVGVVKGMLRRILGKSVLTFEELQTVLCDCESVINSRPLTYLSENSEDFVPLTPAMFLIENRGSGVYDLDKVDSASLKKRVRYRLKLLQDYRHRFRKEYLGLLFQRNPGKRSLGHSLKVDEVVLIGDDSTKRINWSLGRIIELIPGRDGVVRTVRLKTQQGTSLRPIQRIFPLEIPEFEEVSRSRFGRPLNIPERLGLLDLDLFA